MHGHWDVSDAASEPLETEYGGEVLDGCPADAAFSIDEPSQAECVNVEYGGTVDGDFTLESPSLLDRLVNCDQRRLFFFVFLVGFMCVLVNDVCRNQLTLERFLALTVTFFFGRHVGSTQKAAADEARTGQKTSDRIQSIARLEESNGNETNTKKKGGNQPPAPP